MVRWFASWRATRARRPDGIDLAEADRLVSGHRPDPQRYGLGLVLDAARAPARDEELAGEQEAVTRLVAARRAVLSEGLGRSHDAQVPAARKVVVGLAAAMASLVVVGVTAAETGSLPASVQQRAHDMFSRFGVPAPGDDRRQGGDPSGGADPAPTASAVTPTPTPAPMPESSPAGAGTADPSGPQARALCQAWNAAGRDPSGATMDSRSWRALVAMAGGQSRVPALCADLLGTPSSDTAASAAATPRSTGGGPATPGRSAGGRRSGGP